MSKYTPGPWRVGGKEKRVIFAANGDVVARTAAYGEQSETPEAESGNAALIAAAPDLLGACKSALRALKDNLEPGCMDADAIAGLEAAIAKAEGG